MRLLNAYKILASLAPAFTTRDAAAVLAISQKYASTLLSRLAKEEVITRLAQGRWAYSQNIDPLLVPIMLTYPSLSYISLYTALYFHGMIEQIPQTIYAISLCKTKQFSTPLGHVSIHHIAAPLLTGFEVYGKNKILMATPEKALFDTLYFSPAKSLRFASLTELELPAYFDLEQFPKWLSLIKHPGRRSLLEKQLDVITAQPQKTRRR